MAKDETFIPVKEEIKAEFKIFCARRGYTYTYGLRKLLESYTRRR